MTIRTQVDGLNVMFSEDTGLDCSDRPDMARQEFKDETDVNKILSRYGVNTQMRPPEYGEVDYNLDLQQSLDAIREAERAIDKLPEELRSKYFTWERMLQGAGDGTLTQDLQSYFAQKAAEKAALDAAAVAAASS